MKDSFKLVGKLIQLCLLFGVLFSYLMFQGGFVSGFLFYSFIPIFGYFLLFLIYPLSTWKITRTLSNAASQAGGSVEVKLNLERKIGFFLPYLIIEDCFSASLQHTYQSKKNWNNFNETVQLKGKQQDRQVIFPMFKRKLQVSYQLTDLPRGAHHLQEINVKTSDVFGFIKKTASFSNENTIVVYPEKTEIAVKKQHSNFEAGSASSYSLQSRNTHVVTGVREYMPGDRFSWIDWKTTARKQSLITKEFEQEKSANGLLILDASYSEKVNELGFEVNVMLANSIVHYFEKKSTNVGLLSLGDETTYFPPNQLASMKTKLLYHLATLSGIEEGQFAKQLTEHTKQMPMNLFVLVLVTDVDYVLLQALKQVQQKSKQLIIYLTKSATRLTEEDHQLIQQLRISGVIVDLITEDILEQRVIEVSM